MLSAITIQYNQTVLQPNDLWQVSIQNEEGLRIVYLRGTITSKTTGLVYEAITSQFQLPNGQQLLRPYQFSKINVVQSTLVTTTLPLNEDVYEFKTEILDYYNNQVLAFTLVEVVTSKENSDSSLEAGESNQSKPFKFNIRGDVSSQYAYDFKTDFNSNDYARFNLNPSISIFDIPIAADIFITTNNNGIQNSNRFNVHFDYYKFQQILLEKTIAKIEQNPEVNGNMDRISAIKELELESKVKDYKSWKTKLEDPKLKNILKDLEKLDALKSVVNNKELKQKYSKVTKLEKIFKNNSLDDLKTPLKSLEKKGFTTADLNKILEDKALVKLIQSNDKNLFSLVNDLKSVQNPEQYLEYSKNASTNLLSEINPQDILNEKKLTEIAEKQVDGNKIKNLKRIKKMATTNGLALDSLKDVKLADNNKTVLGANINKEIPFSITDIEKYKQLLSKYDKKEWDKLTNLDAEQLDVLLNKFSSKDIDQVNKLIDLGLTDPNKLKQIGSWKEVQELVNFKKEYSSILDNYQNLLSDKKQYKKVIKIQKQIESIEGLSIREIIQDPKNAKSFAKDFDVMGQSSKLLSDFKVIEVGDIYPTYNQMILNGVQIKGGNIEWNPKKVYAGIVAGKIKNQFNNFADTIQTLSTQKKVLWGAKFGMGNKQEDHIHFTYFGGKSNINQEQSSISNGSNHVIGMEGSYLIKEKVKISGEYNYSIYNPDIDVNDEVQSTLQQNGFAYQVNFSCLFPEGEMYIQSEQISALYHSYGLPYIIKDRWMVETGFQKAMFKNQVQANIFFKTETTNTGFNVKLNAYSGNLNLAIKPNKKPYLNIFYNLLHLNSNGVEINAIKNIAHNVSLTGGYNYTLRKTHLATQINYAFQLLNTQNIETINNGTVTLDFDKYYMQRAQLVTISQQIQLNKIQLSALGQMNQFKIPDQEAPNSLYSAEGTIGFSMFKNKLRTLIGGQYAKLGVSTKMGYFTQLNFSITKYLKFNLNIKYNYILDQQEATNMYQGLIFFGRLNFNF
jgi:hypothetical protein